MKAYICTKYCPPEVLKLKEVPKPIPKDDELCVEIFASAVTASDIYIRSSNIPLRFKIPMRLLIGIRKPRKSILGLVFSGQVHAVGKHIKRFKPGDEVFGLTGFRLGTYAEYLCMKEADSKQGCIAFKPNNVSYEEATMLGYGGLLAFQAIEKGNLKQGQNVLIYGSSGTSGVLALQIAKHYGARVSAVCSSVHLNFMKELGADVILDYTKQDYVPEGEKYDLIVDSVGKMKKSKIKIACRQAISLNGKYVSIDDESLKLDSSRLNKIKDFTESGIMHPVLDRCYPFSALVKAHQYVEKGHKKGGVAVTVKGVS